MTIKKATAIFIAVLSLACPALAQDMPKLRPIKEKHLQEALFPTQRKDKWGYANEKGDFRIKALFEEAGAFRIIHTEPGDTVSLARIKYQGKWGLLRRNGTILLSPRFDELRDFDKEVSIFREGSFYGLVSYTGEIILEGLQDLEDFLPSGIAWFQAEDRWGVLRPDGSELFPNIYTSKPVEKLSSELLLTNVDDKVGVISLPKQKTILEPDCDFVRKDPRNPSLIVFRRGGHYGGIDDKGAIVAQAQYDTLSSISGSSKKEIMVRKGGKYGKLSPTGQVLVPPVLETDQVSGNSPLLAFFKDDGSGSTVPYLYYNDVEYSIKGFDDFIHRNLRTDKYVSKESLGFHFPLWMRSYAYREMNHENALSRWKREDAFHAFPDSTGGRYYTCTNKRSDAYVTAGRDMTVNDYGEVNATYGSPLSSVSIEFEGQTFSCGNWLTALFKSVDSQKISQYDRENGTSYLRNWSTISFRFPGMAILNDRLLLIADMYIGSRHMQRIVTSLSTKGDALFNIKESGELYNLKDPLDDTPCFYMVMDDGFVISSLKRDRQAVSSVFYSPAGKAILPMNDFLPIDAIRSDKVSYFFGINAREEGTFLQYNSSDKALTKARIDYNPETEMPRVIAGLLVFSDRESGLQKYLARIENPQVRTPILRYTWSVWDGKKVMGITKNSWDNLSDARWECLPSMKNRRRGYHERIGDIHVNVSEAGENGISVYSVKYDKDSDDALRYGYIGTEEPFFTMAVFDDARAISNGIASVKVGETWYELTMEDLKVFTNSPRGEIMDYKEAEVVEEEVEEEAIPFQLVEQKPSFNGGDANEFSNWVNSRLVYPESAKMNGVQGRVTLQFTVEADGRVTNVKVLRGVDEALDREAVRVVSSSPRWKPGMQRGRFVKVTYTFPVIFQLRED